MEIKEVMEFKTMKKPAAASGAGRAAASPTAGQQAWTYESYRLFNISYLGEIK
jgi:hypothetical protein